MSPHLNLTAPYAPLVRRIEAEGSVDGQMLVIDHFLNHRIETGLDFQTNDHTLRTASGAAVAGYDGKPRIADMRFNSWGVFGELAHELNAAHRLIGGLRVDFSEAQDQRTGRSSSGPRCCACRACRSRGRTSLAWTWWTWTCRCARARWWRSSCRPRR